MKKRDIIGKLLEKAERSVEAADLLFCENTVKGFWSVERRWKRKILLHCIKKII